MKNIFQLEITISIVDNVLNMADAILETRDIGDNSIETFTSNKPILISSEEIKQKSKRDFSDLIVKGSFDNESLNKFVDEKIVGIKLNGVDVLAIDFEHGDEIDYITRAYLESPKTKVVVAEYFYPEIKNNAERAGLADMMTKTNDNYTNRIEHAKKLAEVLKEAHKTVAVADIANKASYIAFRELFRYHLPLLQTVWGLSGLEPETFKTFISLPAMPINLAWLGDMAGVAMLKGVSKTTDIASFEKFIVDFESARRLYASKGIEQLTKQYRSSGENIDSNTQIVVIYPKVHGMRILDNIVHPNKFLDKAKDVIYRTYGPGLDYSVRQWEWKDSLQKLKDSGYRYGETTQLNQTTNSDIASTAGWKMFSDEKVFV